MNTRSEWEVVGVWQAVTEKANSELKVGIAWAEISEIGLNSKGESRWGNGNILYSVVALK